MVTVPDPEEQDGHDSAHRDRADRPDRRSGPEDTDAMFAAIVAEWSTEPDAPRWPADSDRTEQRRAEDTPAPAPCPPLRGSPDNEDEHFEPPEPPPFPVPQPRTIGGVVLVALGVLLLIAPGLLSLSATYGTPLGLLSITAGIGWLVLGLRGGPPPEGWDDGARL
ncbi:MAG TPA: DUF308 domain-containing protein [Pseudonocardiaceae bacterium]|nr:DUF308 domain-containing protein [Pseudonocardiaceae bacterium]